MSRYDSLELVGFVHPTGNNGPSLVTPLFSNGDQDYLQCASNNVIECFTPYEIDKADPHFIKNNEPFGRTEVGGPAVFSFVDEVGGITLGDRSDVQMFISTNWSRFSSN